MYGHDASGPKGTSLLFSSTVYTNSLDWKQSRSERLCNDTPSTDTPWSYEHPSLSDIIVTRVEAASITVSDSQMTSPVNSNRIPGI